MSRFSKIPEEVRRRMAEVTVGITRSSSTFAWPVRWDTMAARAAATDHEPDELADCSLLAAHRVLDRLAAMAFDAVDGVFGAADAFIDAVAELLRTVPDLVPGVSRRGLSSTGASLRTALAAHNEDTGPPSAFAISFPHRHPGNRAVSDGAGASASDTLVDVDGVNTLEKLAFRLAGHPGAHTVRRLSEVAVIAERRLPGVGYPHYPGYLADVSILAGTVAVEHGRAASWATVDKPDQPLWSPQDRMDIAALVQRTPTSCHLTFLRVWNEDLDQNPPPEEGEPVFTTGIERVEVTHPCSASPVMTIHGSGFGAAPASGVGVIAATWDTKTSHVVYRKVAVSSWSDTVIVAGLPENVISGIAAFADFDFIDGYNQWVKSRNSRVADAMHAQGCPGVWEAEVPHSLTPRSASAALYNAGLPRLVADVAPTSGPAERWNASTLHLQIGQVFRVAWQAFGADTVTLRALDAGAQAILAAAGYAGSAGLDASSGTLILAATPTPVRATFGVEANNQCGMTRALVNVMITGPALQPASVTVYQGVAGGDVKVTVEGTGEVLTPSIGATIPLVAGKRSLAVIDWWSAVPQMPPGEALTATATLNVTGPLIGYPGVTLQPSQSTADPAPPDTELELPSGPPFISLASYQQWVAMGNNPSTFNVVLPPEVCQGGEIGGTNVEGWMVLTATVNVRSQDGPTWTLTPGNNVTFYPRRKVRIRYRALGSTADQVCRDALRDAGSLLPIPDPEVVRLPGSPIEQNGHLLEDMIAERGGTATPAWRDEIWMVIGPIGGGGTSFRGTWVASAGATALTCAHEICHLFAQHHLALCKLVGDPNSDPPSSFPNGGIVAVLGYDMWNNAFVPKNALDIMVFSYCPEPTWQSPERWRRVFLQVGRS